MPAALAVHTDFVIGHHRLPNERRVSVLRQQTQNTSGLLGTTPDSIDKAYKLDGATATNKKNLQAIASFLRYARALVCCIAWFDTLYLL